MVAKPIEINVLMKTAINELDQRFRGKEIEGISTGFADLDEKLRISNSNLVILAARPSMGKTALAMNIATSAAMSGKRTLVFSNRIFKRRNHG